jgi:hypothetical protein
LLPEEASLMILLLFDNADTVELFRREEEVTGDDLDRLLRIVVVVIFLLVLVL